MPSFSPGSKRTWRSCYAGDPAALAHVIHRSCEIKAEIVGRDEREQGERALLNLGHTFGHAVESATGYKQWLHGEAIGAGLLMAAAMSRECGLMGRGRDSGCALLERTGSAHADRPGCVAGERLEHMRIDKKVRAGVSG
jgi:3-dehydroquinate synthase